MYQAGFRSPVPEIVPCGLCREHTWRHSGTGEQDERDLLEVVNILMTLLKHSKVQSKTNTNHLYARAVLLILLSSWYTAFTDFSGREWKASFRTDFTCLRPTCVSWSKLFRSSRKCKSRIITCLQKKDHQGGIAVYMLSIFKEHVSFFFFFGVYLF